MSNWFTKAFGRASDAVADHARDAIAEGRHELMGGWFGRNFEPPPRSEPTQVRGPAAEGERDIHGNEHSLER